MSAPRSAPRTAAPSVAALMALVAANLVPLVGVLFFGWSLLGVLLLYWLESGIIGLYNVPRILLAQGTSDAWNDGRTGRPVSNTPTGRLGHAGFFLVHYGAIWAAHFLLLAVAVGPGVFHPGAATADDPYTFPLSVSVLFVSHGLSFTLNYLGRGEYRTALPSIQMWAPHGRVVAYHVATLGGGALAARWGTPVWSLVLLVALKTLIDAGTHVWAHRR